MAKYINLALQGGGAHGALAWGVLDRLLDDDRIAFDSISATSAGAMNAAVLASGLATGGKEGAREALYQFWKEISEVGKFFSPIKKFPIEEFMGVNVDQSMTAMMFDSLSRVFSPYQFNPFNFNPLREVLQHNVDFERIKAYKHLKLFISATNVQTGKIKVFDNSEISVDAIMASACLPFLFQSVHIEDSYYWDGGYMGNPALFPLIYHSDCRDILIVHINPIYRKTLPESATDILNRVNEISFNSSLMREMRAVAFVTQLLDDGWIKEEYRDKIKRIFIHSVRADITMQEYSVASKLNPDWDFLQLLYKEGQQEGNEWLSQHFDALGKKSSIDIKDYL